MKTSVVFLLTLFFSGFFSLSLAQGQSWTSPWDHSHFSTQETPFVHSFNLEPAFLGRELFLSYSSSQEEALHYLHVLRLHDEGWSSETRAKAVAALVRAQQFAGGASLKGFVAHDCPSIGTTSV